MLLPNRLDCHAVKMLTRICLRDVLAGNKYLIVTSYAFVLQNNAFKPAPWFKRTVSVWWYVCTAIVMEKDTMGHTLIL